MSDQQNLALLKKIKELEAEVGARESDLAHFREQLSELNLRLENLIARLHKDYKIANNLQKMLVPTELPHIQGFEFSTKFVPSYVKGGDYFDIFEHENKLRFGLVVSSCSGHSTSALLMSALLKFTGQMEARKGAEPHLVLNKIIQELIPSLENGSEADLFYSMMDRRNFELTFCSLGQVFAFYLPRQNGQVQLLDPVGPSVVPEFNTSLSSQVLPLNPRDKIVICTRGVIEAESLEGEPFGIERLGKALLDAHRKPVHELRNHVLYMVQQFCSGKEPQRDQTVLILEVKDRVIKLAKE